MNKKALTLIAILAFIPLNSCSNDNSSTISIEKATSLNIEEDIVRVRINGNKKIVPVTIEPASFIGKETYKSSDETIATVDSKGNITAKKVGRCTITVSISDLTKECEVVVLPNSGGSSSPSDPSTPDTPTVTSKYSKRTGKMQTAFKVNLPSISLNGVNLNLNDLIPIEFNQAMNVDVNYLSNNNALYLDNNKNTDIHINGHLNDSFNTSDIKSKDGNTTIITGKSQSEQVVSNYKSMYDILYKFRDDLHTFQTMAPAYDTIKFSNQYLSAGESYKKLYSSTNQFTSSLTDDAIYYSNKNDVLSLYNNDDNTIRPRFAFGKDFISNDNTDTDNDFSNYMQSLSMVLKLLTNQGLSFSALLSKLDLNTILSNVDYVGILLGTKSLPIGGITLPSLEDGDLIKDGTGEVLKEASKILAVVCDILSDGFNVYKSSEKYNNYDALKLRFYLTDIGLDKLNNYLSEVCNEKLPDIIKGQIKPSVSNSDMSLVMYSDAKLNQSHFGSFTIDSDFKLNDSSISKLYYDLRLDTDISDNSSYKPLSSTIKDIVLAYISYTNKAVTAIPFVYSYGKKTDVSIDSISGNNIDDAISSYSTLSNNVKFMLTDTFTVDSLKKNYNEGRTLLNEVVNKLNTQTLSTMDDVKNVLDELKEYTNYRSALKEASEDGYSKILAIEKLYLDSLINEFKTRKESNDQLSSASSKDEILTAINDTYTLISKTEITSLLSKYEFKVDSSKLTLIDILNKDELLKKGVISLNDTTVYNSKLFLIDSTNKKNIVDYKNEVKKLISLNKRNNVYYSLYEQCLSISTLYANLMKDTINKSSLTTADLFEINNYFQKASSTYQREVTTQSITVGITKFDDIPKDITYILKEDGNQSLINSILKDSKEAYTTIVNKELKSLREEGYIVYTNYKTAGSSGRVAWDTYKEKAMNEYNKYKVFEEKNFGSIVSDINAIKLIVEDGDSLNN